ncbi:AT-rich interactive domain-containing protein 3A-like isoform X2 [Cataglyphis hispanica]|uniref:AT-rich interactive domain-containing protein 3A-like isoform X2 n=1 Tax=Cataglyphis hispanica TaxID=1086592 RepID=UPI0021808B08|nr:AT-rich interactive domain-containing protein 3A-like isoform X2 [Cataglyphis hispanica]
MDSADEQDVENPGGMANGGSGANGANGAHGANGANGANGQHPTPEGSLSYREEIDESDLDDEVQDDEDLLSQPLQGSSQSPLDIAAQATGASSLAQLNSFMNMHPNLMNKLRMQYGDAEMQQRNGLEALHAAMTGNFNVPFIPSIYMSPPPPPPPSLLQQQPPHPQSNHSQPIASNLANVVENQLMIASASTSASVRPPAAPSQAMRGESPQRNCRNNSESSQGSSRNNGESRECESRTAPANNQHPSGSNWNFEEQFRQLYELDDNPERKEFLDNLFTFMQQRGTPINRLPIMAKSVLDLFELYKLVVMRGGLVEVINKKLWQEIIKGLRLPASITSAAFTLRTQYMKYLYPYEQQKENLSTQEQLQTAIETNRRESRRSNYTTYATNNESMVARSQHNSMPSNSLPLQMPLSMAQMELHGSQSPFVNGHPQHHSHNSQHVPSNLGSNISEYMMKMLRDRSNSITNNSIIPQQTGNTSISPPTTEAFSAIELSKLTLWNLYNQNNNKIYSVGQQSFPPSTSHSPLGPATSPEPQREALDLANSAHRSNPVSPPSASRSVSSPPSGNMKRDRDAAELSSPTPNKRIFSDEENIPDRNCMRITQMVTMRENGRRELAISVDIDGVLYEGVLPAKNDDASSISSNSNTIKRSRNSES